jgi:two-component system phosphate regulon sensor histidine kinase PhoR
MKELSVLVDGLPDPVLVITPDLFVQLFNRAALGLFEQLETNKPLSRATRNSDLLEAIQTAFGKQKKTSLTFVLKKRYKRTINATLIPLENSGDKNDKARLVFIHLRDMSEPERLAKMRMHFIANASHELRTPLASLMGFVETLQTTARKDEQARDRFLAIMAEQTRRMTRLIKDLLSLSQLEMNTEPPPEIQVDIKETVSEVIELLRPLAEKSDVFFEENFSEGSFCVHGEKDELVQVFQNIVQNAIRYGGEGGKVEISITRLAPGKKHGPRLSIAIKDYGRGIAAKHISRLTQRFYRVDKVISRNKGGTGLGLAIARHIILRHRGELVIKSKIGKGTIFKVLLPEHQQNKS